MHVSDLALTDFRSYRDVVVALPGGVSVLVGPNGEGKTNLVEAVAYLATLASHRVAADAALVRDGAERAVVRCKVVHGERTALVELEIVAGRANRARVNRGTAGRARDILGIVRTVLFAPEDLALVKGDPDGRRRYLDELLVMRTPRLAAVRSGYDRVLRQRGALLRSAQGRSARASSDVHSTLDVWDEQLATVGAELVVARRSLVAELAGHVARSYERISGGQGAAAIDYRAGAEEARAGEVPADLSEESVREHLLTSMGRLRGRELDRGMCLVGPHRDDLFVELAGRPARGYASHGESWSLALSLRLASYDLLREDRSGEWSEGGEPVLILDDVFAELDARRRERLAEMVAGAEQVLVTAAAQEDVPAGLSGARFDVRDGSVTRVG